MDKIGPYHILEPLFRGPRPMYRAKAADGTLVALKTIPVAGLSEEARERFAREAETCRTLDHPNLIRVFETGEADGFLYQAMELLEGADLNKVLAEGREFTWEEKISIMEQVCAGLEYAHEHQLVHRDIKPANLFLENSGRVKVLDFGMVRVADSKLTRVGAAVGTLNYMSPEQIRGDRCTAAADVFSTGIVFFQLATGRHPFSARDRSLGQVVSAIVFEKPPRLGEVRPDAPEGLEFILAKALEKDPAQRQQNAGELRQALEFCRAIIRLGVAPQNNEPPGGAPEQDAKPAARPSSTPKAPADGKTRVLERPTPAVAISQPRPPVTPPALPKPQPKPAAQASSAPQARYCPSCTTPNPPDARLCRGCGAPLTAGIETPPAARQSKWPLYVALAAVALLAIALVVVLAVKR
jgi:serine/threonine protein kinase